MKIISNSDIKKLGISARTCVEWVKESFSIKEKSILPPKVSVHPQQLDFFTTMPCFINSGDSEKEQYFGCKIVHRLKGSIPSLGSDLLLYTAVSGELLALFDSDWITAMRTGAVATLAAQTFRKTNCKYYGMLGLGNTARATLLCILETEPNIKHLVKLLKYKNQTDLFIERFINYDNVEFSVSDTIEELVSSSDVIISCITEADHLICPNDQMFQKGCLVIPVHTRGFQNCDLSFDKVFADDTGHVQEFKYFDRFKYYAEIYDVLARKSIGRESDEERIISYNVGLGLHDVVFATKLFPLLKNSIPDIVIKRELDKFWI